MANIVFYEDDKCTKKISTVTFRDSYIEYITPKELKRIFNVVPLGSIAETNIFLKNEGVNDVAIYSLRSTSPEMKLSIFSSGLITPSGVFKIHITYKPTMPKGFRGRIEIVINEIFR